MYSPRYIGYTRLIQHRGNQDMQTSPNTIKAGIVIFVPLEKKKIRYWEARWNSETRSKVWGNRITKLWDNNNNTNNSDDNNCSILQMHYISWSDVWLLKMGKNFAREWPIRKIKKLNNHLYELTVNLNFLQHSRIWDGRWPKRVVSFRRRRLGLNWSPGLKSICRTQPHAHEFEVFIVDTIIMLIDAGNFSSVNIT